MIVRLGRESRQLYERLAESGWRFLGLKEAVACGGKNSQASRKLLERLVRAGSMVKLQRDRYGLCRDGEGLHPLAVGRELAGGCGYYVNHGSAMAVWGMVDDVITYPRPLPKRRGSLSDPEGKGELENVVTISLPVGLHAVVGQIKYRIPKTYFNISGRETTFQAISFGTLKIVALSCCVRTA